MRTVKYIYHGLFTLGGCFNEKWQLVGTTVLGASVLLGACGGNDGGSGDGKDLKGSAKGEGSSTVALSLKN